jgi:hypothetical protein
VSNVAVRAPAVVQVRLLAGTDAALDEAIRVLSAALPGQLALGKSGKPGQYGQRRAYGTLTLAAVAAPLERHERAPPTG